MDNELTTTEASTGVKPLTRKSNSGDAYKRDPGVERSISEALKLSKGELLARADKTDTEAPGYLKEESLVYFLRESHLRSDTDLTAGLSAVLLKRCTGYIASKLRALGVDAEDAQSETVMVMLERILDPASDRGDFFQVKFWLFLDRVLSDVLKKYRRLAWKASQMDAPDWVHGSEQADEPEPGTHYSPPVAAGGLTSEQRMLMREALNTLDDPYKTLVVLRYYDGWPVESNDPTEPTISKYFNKTPRTIRNWMTTAEQRLQEWREGAL